MRDLSKTADTLAARWKRVPAWDDLRDWIDSRTDGELDCQPLDILTDMVMKRIKPASVPAGSGPQHDPR